MHCSKARDTVDRAIQKHEMKNAEELPVGKVSSAAFLYIGQQFLTVFCEGDELRDGAQLSLQ